MKKIKDEREKKKRKQVSISFLFPLVFFLIRFQRALWTFFLTRIRGRFFSLLFFTSFVPFHLFERTAFCACTMTINIITFAVSRNLYRSLGEILLCSIIRRKGKGGKASYARVEIKIVGAACFIPAKLAPQSVYSLRAGAHAFVPVFIRFLTWRQFSLRDHATNYRRFPLLMDG